MCRGLGPQPQSLGFLVGEQPSMLQILSVGVTVVDIHCMAAEGSARTDGTAATDNTAGTVPGFNLSPVVLFCAPAALVLA